MTIGVILGTWMGAAAAPIERPCATLDRLPSAPALRQAAPAAAALPTKIDRDPFGLPNTRTSTNFAVHYGNGSGASAGDIDRLLDAFELAWAVQIDTMGHPAPVSTDTYRFNVYLGDSGDGAPDGYGAAGYYSVDPEGYPMVVVASVALNDPDSADGTAHHEFYHAIQGSLGRYDYDGAAAWYWEATAEWAAIETDPGNPTNGSFVFAYLLLPQLPVNAFDYPDTGALEEYYQYGAFLFPHDLTQQLGYEIVRDSWTVPGNEPDPLEVLRDRVLDEGQDLDALWLDHLGRNVAYDYAAGEWYRTLTDWYAPYFPQAEPIADQAASDGGAGRVAGDRAPRRYGAATIQLDAPDEGVLTVEITGDAQGTSGSPAQYGARIVRITGDQIAYDEVPFAGTTGQAAVAVGGEDRVFLVVGAWTETWREARWLDEGFPFDWSLRIEEPQAPTTPSTTTPTSPTTDTTDETDPGTDEDPKGTDGDVSTLPGGCGCTSGPLAPPPAAVWFGIAAAALARRRHAPLSARTASRSRCSA